MLVYRIANERFINELSGKGAELAGGRWNPKGRPALYASSSLALCICEILVHSDKDIPPGNMRFAELFVPDKLVSDKYFSKDCLECSVQKGTEWLRENSSLAIKVPSALLPNNYSKDFNIVINPNHKDMPLIKIQGIYPLEFDARLFK